MLQAPINLTALSAASTQPKGADIWLLDFSALTENHIEKISHYLSPEELTRAQTFKRTKHQFIATRALMRKVLSHYTGTPSAALAFARKEHGKPYLTNAANPIFFNLSHSGNFAALAVTSVGEIGIDIETIRARNFFAIAERYYHTDELTQLLATPEAEQKELFFKLWTLKEAFFKATGGGISSGLDKACFQLTGKNIGVRFAAELQTHASDWQFHQTAIAPNCLVAIALQTTQVPHYQFFNGNELLAEE